MKKPNFFLWFFLAWLLKVKTFLDGHQVTNKIKIKKPCIILSNHASFQDYIYLVATLYPKRITFLAAAKMFYEKGRGPFLKMARAIPMSSYQGDLKAVKNTFEILKKNGIVGIFPEGQIAYHGATLKPPFAIAKLVKKANVDVYTFVSQNTYLMYPPWSQNTFKGKTFSKMDYLFKKDELASLSDQEIYEKIYQALYFDAGEFNKQHRYTYEVQNIANLENLIYLCPKCHFEGLKSQDDKLVCPKCQNELIYDKYGLLDNKSMKENFENQRQIVEKEIINTPQFKLETSVKIMRYVKKKLVVTGEGLLSLSKEKYLYVGSDKGQEVTYEFDPKKIEYIPGDIGGNIQIYDAYEVYMFQMDIKYLPIKFIICGEYFYRVNNQNIHI